MKEKICPICNNHSNFRLRKSTSDYYQCSSCRMLYCDPIDQTDMVGGEHEIGRNESQNSLRITRINEMTLGAKKDSINILDFGAGHGYFVRDLINAGYKNVTAYDAYNEEFSMLPEKNKYHIVTMTEVIEHIPSPFLELDVINRSLLDGGILTVETSFVNVADEDGIPLDDFFYIAPQNGHSTIHSHHSMDLLMMQKGFIPVEHINRHVRNYRKIKNIK